MAANFSRNTPYNDLPLLPPGKEIETVRTLKALSEPVAEIALLKGLGDIIPNQRVLLRAITLQEAKHSSEIENIVTTNDALYQAFSDDMQSVDPHTKEVINYEEAVWHGIAEIKGGRPLSASLFVELVQIITKTGIGVRQFPGTIVQDKSTGETVYTPPVEPGRITGLLDNLASYMVEDQDVHPLIKICVTHYQFEAIHPFSDGNGRTGRVINMLFLMESGMLSVPVIYPSRYILENKAAYYALLRKVTEEDAWEDWIVFMLEGFWTSAKRAQTMTHRIREAIDNAVESARIVSARHNQREVIELLYSQPVTRIKHLTEAGIAQRHTVSRYLKEYENLGILTAVPIGRETLYVNQHLISILSD